MYDSYPFVSRREGLDKMDAKNKKLFKGTSLN